jgi:hypothetical protein
MPLGRPNLTNLETEENRRRLDETALLSHTRQETPLPTWSASGFLPRDVQLTADKPHQPARVILPIKAQLTCKSFYSFVPVRSKVAIPFQRVRTGAPLNRFCGTNICSC